MVGVRRLWIEPDSLNTVATGAWLLERVESATKVKGSERWADLQPQSFTANGVEEWKSHESVVIQVFAVHCLHDLRTKFVLDVRTFSQEGESDGERIGSGVHRGQDERPGGRVYQK